MKPLYNHYSSDTAYCVSGYPYGGLRTYIRFWIEKNDSKGFRFVSQTQNPKTFHWNIPKKSTYALLAACMYLDEKEHTVWSGLSEYSSAEDVLTFIQNFPETDLSRVTAWIPGKKVICKMTIAGKPIFAGSIVSEQAKEEAKKELAIYDECFALLCGMQPTRASNAVG